MKTLSLLFGPLLLVAVTFAQAPQAFKYQAVARYASGEPLENQQVAVQISILVGSASGEVVYSEKHDVTTNQFGLFDLEIGNPDEVVFGTFQSISWGENTHFLKLELDENGGTNFQLMGISQLLSVPYALLSENTVYNDDADADPTNEFQTISKEGQTVTLSNGGGSFTDEVNDADADPTNELQNLTQNGLDVLLSQGGGTINVADNDNNASNELQQLSKVGSTVSLSQNGGSFTDEVNDADANPANELQNISRNGLNITLSQGGGTVNIADNDNDPANELQSLSNTKNGNLVNLGITNGTSTTIDVSDTDANPINELQTLSQNGLEVVLSQGGGTINVADNDNDAVNELQTLTQTDYQVTLSQGGGTFLSGVLSYTQTEIDALTPYNGLTVHNSTTNCINYYFLNNWYEACGTCTPQPTQPNAGTDQFYTDTTTSVTLQGNTPSSGTGLWTVISGEGGAFEDAANPVTVFTGSDCEDYVLQWAISNSCSAKTDDISIGFDYQPTVPDAGPDQIGIGGNSTTLAGNTPVQGTGLWTIISSDGGSLSDPTSSNSTFTGVPTTDYVLAWTISTHCASMSDEVNIRFWDCGLPVTDERDGKIYSTILIGTQCWMAENLNVGTLINSGTPPANNGIIEKHCYSDLEANCDIYGGMYFYDEMMNYSTNVSNQGICPTGWHLPMNSEFQSLLTLYDSQGGPLKTTGTVQDGTGLWNTPNAGATNISGFSALPGGRYNFGYSYFNNLACFWSTSGYKLELYSWSNGLHFGSGGEQGYSVRCIKDSINQNNQPPNEPQNPSPVQGAIDQPLNTTLSWECSDPENDSLTYDVYFGTEANPAQVATGQAAVTFNPGTLSYNTEYFWKIVANDDKGNSTEGTVWSFTTEIYTWHCGETLMVNHTASGGVAPVDKTVTYGTILTDLTGSNKCWITQNLGADQQASSAFDASEAAAGWYWQFNRKQGYSHDGTNRIPNTAWNVVINEPLEWALINDPCSLLLGGGWRIPTYQEWGNVDFNGNWNNAQDAFASVLKLHTAGNLYLGDGTLAARGYEGLYWSPNRMTNEVAFNLHFWNTVSYATYTDKRYGFPLRCINDATSQANQPPVSPSNPQPSNSAIDQPLNTTLSWACSDPENDPLTYDVYFGTINPPTVVSSAQTETTYDPGSLTSSTNYYWKIVANDDKGNSTEGPVWSFTTIAESSGWTCGDVLVDTRDGQEYNTVQIGTQCWMAENLNIGTNIDGTVNPANNSVIEKYCYSNSEAQCDVYGGLYLWDEMMDYSTTAGVQGICPDGWHLPADTEWCTLEQEVDPTITCNSAGFRGVDGGGKLKETGTTHWSSPNTGATNSSGFTALPGGDRHANGSFESGSNYGIWWSSSQRDASTAWSRYLFYDNTQVYRTGNNGKSFGFSVRCFKDQENLNLPPTQPSNPNPEDGGENQPIETEFQWTCSDPDEDPLTYDVYFGTTNPPPVVSSGQTATTYDPGLLVSGTSYYWKIVAHDDQGNSTEGPVWSFATIAESPIWTCGDVLIDTRDGQQYNTVQIGTQCWMAQNLNVGIMINTPANQIDNGSIEKFCSNNSESNCETYGGLYQWNEMMWYSTTPGIQGICPIGWHIPTDDEWCELIVNLDNTVNCSILGFQGTDIGCKMKETGTSHWKSPNICATNSSGFTALAGGRYAENGNFYQFFEASFHWSSSQLSGTSNSFLWHLYHAYGNIYHDKFSTNNGFSVRCLKDQENLNLPPTQPSNPFPEDGAGNQPIETELQWTCSDPDEDPLTYDVYFGTTNTPPVVTSGQTETTYDPGLLVSDTSYYWKIVAHDDQGNSTEGPVWSFATIAESSWGSCGDVLIDTRDGQQYNTVQIGTQCWIAQNLNVGTKLDLGIYPSNNGIIEKYCYLNLETNCLEYGGWYFWDEMMQYSTVSGIQGICPNNWHLPTDTEITTMTDFLGGSTVAAGAMKSTGTFESGTGLWYTPNSGATNSSGFTALPSGAVYGGTNSQYLHSVIHIWSSSELSTNDSWLRVLYNNTTAVTRTSTGKFHAFSVRCIKDN